VTFTHLKPQPRFYCVHLTFDLSLLLCYCLY